MAHHADRDHSYAGMNDSTCLFSHLRLASPDGFTETSPGPDIDLYTRLACPFLSFHSPSTLLLAVLPAHQARPSVPLLPTYFRPYFLRLSELWSRSLVPTTPFSTSTGSLGVGGTSSCLPRLRDSRPCDSLTDLGNSDRLGVRAVTTRRADLRMLSRTFHSLFFAM